MIKSFRTRSLKKLYERGDGSKINPDHIERIRDILFSLDVSVKSSDMDIPGRGLHKMKGEFKGFWAVTVSGNYRVWFQFKDGNVIDVYYDDYH
jgi:proteic killer suppression protein